MPKMFDLPSSDEDGFEDAADAQATAWCPYCGEPTELMLDPAGGNPQEYIEDCAVCCRPWNVTVRWDESGLATVDLRVEDDY